MYSRPPKPGTRFSSGSKNMCRDRRCARKMPSGWNHQRGVRNDESELEEDNLVEVSEDELEDQDDLEDEFFTNILDEEDISDDEIFTDLDSEDED